MLIPLLDLVDVLVVVLDVLHSTWLIFPLG